MGFAEWSGKSALRRQHLSGHLDEVRKPDVHLQWRRPFQAEGLASTKTLKREGAYTYIRIKAA